MLGSRRRRDRIWLAKSQIAPVRREAGPDSEVNVRIRPGFGVGHAQPMPGDRGKGSVDQSCGDGLWSAAGNRNAPEGTLRRIAWRGEDDLAAVCRPCGPCYVRTVEGKLPRRPTGRRDHNEFPSSASSGKYTDKGDPFSLETRRGRRSCRDFVSLRRAPESETTIRFPRNLYFRRARAQSPAPFHPPTMKLQPSRRQLSGSPRRAMGSRRCRMEQARAHQAMGCGDKMRSTAVRRPRREKIVFGTESQLCRFTTSHGLRVDVVHVFLRRFP